MTKRITAIALGVSAILISKAARLETLHEGRRAHAYDDHDGMPIKNGGRITGFPCLGHPTVGIGFNLDRNGARAAMAEVGADYDSVRAGNADLTDEQVESLFAADLERAVEQARRDCPAFYSLPEQVQLVLVDMTFNMGSVSGFPRMLQAIERRDWGEMIAQMLDSKWAKLDVPVRAKADVALVRTLLETPAGLAELTDAERARALAVVALTTNTLVIDMFAVHDTEPAPPPDDETA